MPANLICFVFSLLVAVNAQWDLPITGTTWDSSDQSCCNWEVSSCGPCPTITPICRMKDVILTPVDGPVFYLPSPPPPPPTVISNKCCCTKTVLKPQLYQRIIQVQKNQRFIKKSFKPVMEEIAFCAKPRC